jgi:dTDP-4-amino-4,6-dideoxygalactose transaminase
MTDVPLVPQANPGASYLVQRAEIDAAVARVLGGGWYILGEEVRSFEAEFAAWLGVSEAVGVANGTDAIELALRALGIGAGKAVIAPSHTATATVAAIERAGARPVLVDVDPISGTITAPTVEAVVTSREDFGGWSLAAVIPVHLYGHPADILPIVDVARTHGLRVIEDCAQAHGARVGEHCVGSFGDLATFSFYPTKNLGAFGDGGLVATNDPQLADQVRSLREYGWEQRYVSTVPGINSRLDELQAAILRVKLQRLDAYNNRRREIARRYSAGLSGMGIGLPPSAPGLVPVFHQYVIQVETGRDALRAFLEKQKIATAIHYRVPVHLQPAYRDRGLCFGKLPVTEKLCDQIVSLPMFPQLTDAQVDRVIGAICEWPGGPRRKASRHE